MKISLIQHNPIIGDFAYNKKLLLDGLQYAQSTESDLVIFPELALTGYAPRDLLLRTDFLNQSRLLLMEEILPRVHDFAVILGLPWVGDNGRLYNGAAFLANGQIQQISYKRYLPNYDVFDEERYFTAGTDSTVVEWQGVRFGLTICEDLWNCSDIFNPPRYAGNLLQDIAQQEPDVLVNIAASPYQIHKNHFRNRLMSHIAQKYQKPLIFVNQVGGQDSLVFCGGSSVWDKQGQKRILLPYFQSNAQTIEWEDLEKNKIIQESSLPNPSRKINKQTENNRNHSNPDYEESLLACLITGIRDYAMKNNFKRALLGLSGGIDSALIAVLAAMALGAQNVHVLLLPSPYSSEGSINDSLSIAKKLNISYEILPIVDIYHSYLNSLDKIISADSIELTHENIQARIRGNLLMAYANKQNALLLTTSNKSESAVGYATLYGDMAGGLAPIADLYKTQVYTLCHYINAEGGHPLLVKNAVSFKNAIPKKIIEKAPSAELRPDQKDSDSLPDYPVLDFILQKYIDQFMSAEEIALELKSAFPMIKKNAEHLVQDTIKKIHFSEHKRKQATITLKVSERDFTLGWRFPITQRFHLQK